MENVHDGFESEPTARTGVQQNLVRKLRGVGEVLSEHVIGSRAHAWLDRTTDYLEQTEPAAIEQDFTKQIRRNPGTSLLVAGAAGFVLSAILRRR